MFNLIKALMAILVLISSAAANADIAIIAHADYQGGELNEEIVKQLFLKERDEFPSGHKAKPANHAAGSQDRKYFFEYVLQMGETRHKRYWARKKSIGKPGAPDELNSHDEVLDWVAKTPLGISYVDNKVVDGTVKVLLTIAVFDDI